MSCAGTEPSAAYNISMAGLVLNFLDCIVNLERKDIVDKANRVSDISPESFKSSYDFIIIGGGAGGSVLAARLAEHPNCNILVLEAGKDETTASEVPAAAKHTQSSPQAYKMETEKSDKACLSTGGKCSMSSGKSLGGSSSIGETINTRGNSRDYDEWERQGNKGWAFEYLEDIFIGLENVKIPELMNKSCRGYQGKLSAEFPRFLSPIAEKIMLAGKDLSYINPDGDYNCQQQCGFAQIQQCLHCGLRCSAAKAFLRPLANATNIHFSMGTNILKILIDDGEHHRHEFKRAYGIKFIRDGKIYKIKVIKEIILTASAIYNPQILLLSGIGPRKELHKHNIKCIHNLPGVGSNYMDHISFKGLNYHFKNQIAGNFLSLTNANTLDPNSVECFCKTGDGPMYGTPGQEITAFINSRHPELPKCSYPNFQLMFGPLEDLHDGLSISTMILRPKSRGCITLKDNDPSSKPLIDPKYFDDPRDMNAMLSAIRFAQRTIQTPTFKTLGAALCKLPTPECDKLPDDSDDYWLCMMKWNTQSHHHASGTCKMGPHDDKMAVVDHKLRVRGIENLRIADSSIMPIITSGNPSVPTMMIAEKAARMLQHKYKL